MDDKERQQRLNIIGESVRLSELPDSVLVKHAVIHILSGLYQANISVDSAQLGEMLAVAFVDLGGFHRAASCAW